jgi:hypothetical protein
MQYNVKSTEISKHFSYVYEEPSCSLPQRLFANIVGSYYFCTKGIQLQKRIPQY